MGIPVLIAGESGSGKTYSIKALDPEQVGIFLCEKSRLPFRKQFNTYKVRNMQKDVEGKTMIYRQSVVIQTVLRNPKDPKKIYIIDDSQYIMANEFFDRANENGYQKFVDIGANFRNLIHLVNNELPDDVIVYFLHHPEMDSNTGKMKAKTIGKMLDEKLTLEGCFDIVLFAKTDGAEHWFETQSDGTTTAKSPEEMFDAKIPNDMAFVDRTIREYYGLEPLEIKEKEGN
ncbi:MAG: AAA family ATPase [Oscillospiraceae bacterium]|nr:AAA family ATPase [Oscillospiraceae bacterium]